MHLYNKCIKIQFFLWSQDNFYKYFRESCLSSVSWKLFSLVSVNHSRFVYAIETFKIPGLTLDKTFPFFDHGSVQRSNEEGGELHSAQRDGVVWCSFCPCLGVGGEAGGQHWLQTSPRRSCAAAIQSTQVCATSFRMKRGACFTISPGQEGFWVVGWLVFGSCSSGRSASSFLFFLKVLTVLYLEALHAKLLVVAIIAFLYRRSEWSPLAMYVIFFALAFSQTFYIAICVADV